MAGETILVVEDEPLVGVELQEWLTELGYAVPEVIDDGGKVSFAAKKHRPDLILMDIRIKGTMDGVQAASQIRLTSDVPIIFLTAYSDADTVARATETRPDGMLFKPFRERELEVNVALALKKARDDGREGKNLAQWSSFIDTLETALVLFDRTGRWIHANPKARSLFGFTPQGTPLPTLLGVEESQFQADPHRWTNREFPLGEPGSDRVFSVDEISEGNRLDGFLMGLHSMEKHERDHLQSSLMTIQANLAALIPPSEAYAERLSHDGFLIARPSGTGDFYDLFPIGPHHFLFYSLDVSGHGILSSMSVATLRWMIRELAGNALVRTNEVPSPAAILEALNQRYLAANPNGPMFTLTLGIVAPSSGDLLVVRAGHPSPLVVGPEGSCRSIGAAGSALGVFPELLIEETEDRLRQGERLVLSSDGVLERLGDRSLERGLAVLAELVGTQASLTSQVQAVRQACLSNGEPQADDLSLLILECKLW